MFDLPKDSGKLKLDLFCRGARVGENCRLAQDTRPIKRTRGGLGSGLDAILPGHVWVNIPTEEPFAKESPYIIRKVDGKYGLWRDNAHAPVRDEAHGKGRRDYGTEGPRASSDAPSSLSPSVPQQLGPSKKVCDLTLPAKPDWYEAKTSSGKRIGDIGVMQGTYFAIYPSDLCGFWKSEPRLNCRFCSIGLCHGKTESEEKTVLDVVEAVRIARQHEKITFVHFNTGYIPTSDEQGKGRRDYGTEGRRMENVSTLDLSPSVPQQLSPSATDAALDLILPYVEAVKKETGLLVGVQCPPALDLARYDRLKAAGADHVSFCFELFDPERFAEVCPGKAEVFGQAAHSLSGDPWLEQARQLAQKHLCDKEPHPGQLIFYRALLYCARKLWGKGPVAGEIIAGLEPSVRSMQAVDFLAECGAVATVCVFRPCIGTDLENESPPEPGDLAPVFARQWEAVAEHGIPIGIAPNIRTAMVHLQEESRCFSENAGPVFYRMKCTAMKAVYRPLCALKRSD